MRSRRPLAFWRLAVLAAAIAAPSSPAAAQNPRIETVSPQVARAGAVLSGRIVGDASAEYRVQASAGQVLSVDLLSRNGALNFNVTAQGAQEALFIGATAGTVGDIVLPEAGRYIVQVYLMRSAARRGESADYTLGIGVGDGDFADGLAGGPDWWAVTGLRRGGLVNIRSGPHRRYPALTQVANGALARNQGCRMTGPDRWCRVMVGASGRPGWVIGRHLAEAAPPAAAGPP